MRTICQKSSNTFAGLSTLITLVCALLIPFCASASPSVVLILDDVGYRHTDIRALSLPKEVTFSVLPDTPLGRTLSEQGHAQGRDIMLHLPMEADNGNRLGPRALKVGMFPENIAQTLQYALDSVPYAIGVNNHMGSRLTREPEAMEALMHAISQRSLFFIDSRTTADSVAESTARQVGIPTASRHIFIDHVIDEEAMQVQFDRLIRIAKKEGVAIGIAHPHPSTLRFLNRVLANVDKEGVTLEPVSDYFAPPSMPRRHLASATNRTVVAPE